MLDKRDDGTIGIPFADGDTTRIVVVRPPKVGGYRRLRKELYSIDGAEAKYVADLPEGTSDLDAQNLRTAFHENALLAWWQLVLRGDDTFARLTTDEVPDDSDEWPMELALNTAAQLTLVWWVTHPLGSSGPQATTNTTQPSVPSPEAG